MRPEDNFTSTVDGAAAYQDIHFGDDWEPERLPTVAELDREAWEAGER